MVGSIIASHYTVGSADLCLKSFAAIRKTGLRIWFKITKVTTGELKISSVKMTKAKRHE